MYVPLKSACQIWEELERQYKTEDSGNKIYLVSNYFDFKMVDDKPILGQIHDLQLIVHQLLYEGISIDERFEVGATNNKKNIITSSSILALQLLGGASL